MAVDQGFVVARWAAMVSIEQQANYRATAARFFAVLGVRLNKATGPEIQHAVDALLARENKIWRPIIGERVASLLAQAAVIGFVAPGIVEGIVIPSRPKLAGRPLAPPVA